LGNILRPPMPNPKDQADSASDDPLVADLLRQAGVPLDGRVKISVHTTRIRVNPDGTRTVLSDQDSRVEVRRPKSRRNSRRIAIAVVAFGLVQMGYSSWAGRSDLAAASRFKSDANCRSHAADSVCGLESAVVVERKTISARHGTSYYLTTVSSNGTRDYTPLVGLTGTRFWDRVKPTQPISIQRFVAPGYHLTGSITAFSDSSGWVMTRYNPDSGTHYEGASAFLGFLITVTGSILYLKALRDSRRQAATP
jgi:hypothetical protein